MPYRIDWLIKDHIILIEMIGDVTLEDLHHMTLESQGYVERGAAHVHAVVDQRQVSSLPSDMRQVIATVRQVRVPPTGISVMVMPRIQPLFKFIASVLMQVVSLDYRFANTFEEALIVLSRIDPDIPIDALAAHLTAHESAPSAGDTG